VEATSAPETIEPTPKGQRDLLRTMGLDVKEYSPEQFAEAAFHFYEALISLEVERSFAERLTIAFIARL